MQQLVAIDQIKFRATALRLPLAELARDADVRPSTVLRIVKGDTPNPRVKTLERISAALAVKETEMRRHLRALERAAEGRQLDLVDTLRGGTP